MKKILTKFPNGLKTLFVVALVVTAGFVTVQKTNISQAQTVQDYPETTTNLVSRVGSLLISSVVSQSALDNAIFNNPLFPVFQARCERAGNQTTQPAPESCLDVAGTGIFAELFTNHVKAYVLGKTLVAPSTNPGPTGQVPTLVVADTAGTNDSIMVSDLGRFSIENDPTSDFTPMDKTTMRGVCAGTTGELYACDVPTPPDAVCPLTHTDSRTDIIYPIVNIDGTCWFGTDLEYSELTPAQALEFQKAAGQSIYYPGTPSFYNGSTPYYTPSVEIDGLPELTALCSSLLTGTLDYFDIGENTNPYHYQLKCWDTAENNVTKQYIHSTGNGLDVSSGPYFMSNMATNGTCPSGWHIPTDTQWREMETFFGMSSSVVDKFPNEGYSGSPVGGVTSVIAGSTTHVSRIVSKTTAKLVEMGFDTGAHTYFMRDKTLLTTTSSTSLAHMAREIFQTGSDTEFERWPLTASTLDPSWVYNTNPLSLKMRLVRLFVNVAEAISPELANAKIRCVQGDAPITRSIGQWGACVDTDPSPETDYNETRSYTCSAGSYQINTGHCDELYGAVATSQSCVPSGGGK